MTGVVIAAEPAGGEQAHALLNRYYGELAERFPPGREAFDLARIAAPATEFAPPHGQFLIARRDAQALGCGALRLLEANVGEIKRLWVDPAARGLGIGRGLLTALESAAVDLGCHTARLDTASYLPESLALYRAAGYLEIPSYNDNPYAAHWLEKRLA